MLGNLLISIHIYIQLPTIMHTGEQEALDSIIHVFQPSVQSIYRRDRILSFFNPFLIYEYIAQDWKTLLNIPSLVTNCTFVSDKLLLGLRLVSVIPNFSITRLPLNLQLPVHTTSSTNIDRVKIDHMLVVVFTSAKTKFRFDVARQSWIPHLVERKIEQDKCVATNNTDCIEFFRCCLNTSNTASAKMIVLSDENDRERGIITLPELKDEADYLDGQHRQLRIMKHIIKDCEQAPVTKCLLRNIRWIALIEDNTWFNVNKTLAALSLLDWKRPVVVGHLPIGESNGNDLLYITSTAGIFLSKSAFVIIGSRMYLSCPYCKSYDLTIGACSAISSIERIHMSVFLTARPIDLTATMISNAATIHGMSPHEMLNLSKLI